MTYCLKVKTENVQCRKAGTLLAGGTTFGGTPLAVGTTCYGQTRQCIARVTIWGHTGTMAERIAHVITCGSHGDDSRRPGRRGFALGVFLKTSPDHLACGAVEGASCKGILGYPPVLYHKQLMQQRGWRLRRRSRTTAWN